MSIDTILCSNVLEHVEDDDAVLSRFYRFLPQGGRLVLLVPALRILYNTLDRELGHFRRYTKRELTQKLKRSHFHICSLKYFNFFGILGWFVNGTLLRRRVLPAGQVRKFNQFVPLMVQMERWVPTLIGAIPDCDRRKGLEEKLDMKLSVIIPVYNEATTILEIIKRVKEAPFEKEIIVVNDGSTDGTGRILEENRQGLTILFNEKNCGKGAAIRTALPRVTGDLVVTQDADLEDDPSEYSKLIGPIVNGKADVVYGSRFLGGPHRVLLSWHSIGNKIVSTLSNMLTNLNLTDMETGYKAFRAEVLKGIKIESNRFGFEPEITAKSSQMGCRIYEIPISYWGRDYTQRGKRLAGKMVLLPSTGFSNTTCFGGDPESQTLRPQKSLCKRHDLFPQALSFPSILYEGRPLSKRAFRYVASLSVG